MQTQLSKLLFVQHSSTIALTSSLCHRAFLTEFNAVPCFIELVTQFTVDDIRCCASTGLPSQPPNMREKKDVDDLFRRLVQVGVIKVLPEPRAVSPAPVGTPPLQVPVQPAPLAQAKPPAKPEPAKKEDISIPLLKLESSALKM